MRIMRETTRHQRGYSLEDAADFLEYDRKTIEYWLRMGHLAGEWDKRSSGWTISPQSLIDFLKQSREPLPTGTGFRKQKQPGLSSRVPAEMLAD
jgi:hypothetical protein